MIRQGDVFWLDLGRPLGAEPGFLRPYVVIQNDLFNSGAIQTAVLCLITTNLRRAKSPGNVLLDEGEANLPGQSVVNVTQLATVNKDRLAHPIGHLSRSRIELILGGIAKVVEPSY